MLIFPQLAGEAAEVARHWRDHVGMSGMGGCRRGKHATTLHCSCMDCLHGAHGGLHQLLVRRVQVNIMGERCQPSGARDWHSWEAHDAGVHVHGWRHVNIIIIIIIIILVALPRFCMWRQWHAWGVALRSISVLHSGLQQGDGHCWLAHEI